MSRPTSWATLADILAHGEQPQQFNPSDLSAYPEPVRRYFTHAIAEGTPLAHGVRLRMHGRIKLGMWLPFRAEQLLAPNHGTVWVARVGGVISGSDHYVHGEGAMQWRLLGLVPVMRAGGKDISQSGAGRVAGESVWVPTAIAGAKGLEARALADDRIAVNVDVDGETITVEHTLDGDGRVVRSQLQRWGDPDSSGEWRLAPFGIEVTGWRTFGGVSIPSAGRGGWNIGTDRWDKGEFMRYEITHYAFVGAGRS